MTIHDSKSLTIRDSKSLTVHDSKPDTGRAAGPEWAGFRRNLLRWYANSKRDLPWRRTRDPYRIWISEVMLQQTRVAAVIPYYERFLERFPDFTELAAASEADLLTRWAGLGYYSRARNLQKAAKQMVEGGGFPCGYEGIRALAGVGDYTAAAVGSIAFDLPYAVLDGNVARVLARLTAEPGNVHSSGIKRRLQAVAQGALDRKRPGEFNQALMELGATVCLPRDPRCLLCPVAKQCAARKLGLQGELPVKRVRRETVFVERLIWVIVARERVLLRKTHGGFWELPEPFSDALPIADVGEFRHSITHHNYRFVVQEAKLATGEHEAKPVGSKPDGFVWHRLDGLDEIPLSTAAKKGIRCWRKVRG